ncbi:MULTISPECIES: hypothetical protein [Bacillus cereus group]|nr:MULTISPECIES: hypothetical protein [Bacillus cereus group]MEC3018498.1 hypothetical protein [Bacillus cereus]MEC3226546.1 hypothetical protein [Bacillus thuringiensis]MEC3259937.1 hypothetical protein [Bacillus cereus]MEC3464464.1 hypothetical protein [Bacillus thuringiensis]MEC3557169.1 hypothetical protein [Bacillus thuringiensis]
MNIKKVVLASTLGLAASARANIIGLEAIKTNTVTIEGPVL